MGSPLPKQLFLIPAHPADGEYADSPGITQRLQSAQRKHKIIYNSAFFASLRYIPAYPF